MKIGAQRGAIVKYNFARWTMKNACNFAMRVETDLSYLLMQTKLGVFETNKNKEEKQLIREAQMRSKVTSARSGKVGGCNKTWSSTSGFVSFLFPPTRHCSFEKVCNCEIGTPYNKELAAFVERAHPRWETVSFRRCPVSVLFIIARHLSRRKIRQLGPRRGDSANSKSAPRCPAALQNFETFVFIRRRTQP